MRITRVTLLILAVIIGFGFYRVLSFLIDDVDVQALQAVEEVMVDSSHLLAGVVEKELESGGSLEDGVLELKQSVTAIDDHQVYSKIYQREKQNVSLGVYVVNGNGVVVYDSDGDKRLGLNYSRFNDVRLTLLGKYGARSSRLEDTDENSSVMYVGAPIKYKGEIIGSLSVYKKQADVREFVEARGRKIVWVTVVTGLAVIVLCAAVLIWLYRPIGKLTQYAEAVAAGERRSLPSLGKGREVNTLGNSLHQMREILEGRRYAENYVNSLTHELKSPLAGIKGSAELLQEDNMPQEKRDVFLKNINKEVRRGEALVKDLLHLSQLEGMNHLETKKSISIKELVTDVVGDMADLAKNSGVSIEQKEGEGCTVQGDYKILQMTLLHLIENAIEFSEPKSVVDVSWKVDEMVKGKVVTPAVVIKVVDQGVGMPEYAEDRVFEHFYSLPRPGDVPKSTGLGLPLVREAMTLHGGEVTLINRPNEQGCEAVLYLPLKLSD